MTIKNVLNYKHSACKSTFPKTQVSYKQEILSQSAPTTERHNK